MLASLLASLLAASSAGDRPRLAVLDLQATGGADPAVSQALTDSVVTEVSRRGYYEVVSSADLRTLLSVERQKQLLGCSEGSSCLAEVADAVGSRFVLSGTLAKLGDSYQLTLQGIDSQKAQPVGRTVKIAKDLEQLRGIVPYAVAEATATPLPAPPSKVLPLTFLITGGAAVVAAGILTVDGFSKDGQLASELERSKGLLDAESYRAQAAAIGTEKTAGLIAGIAGAVLVGAGIFFWPKDPLANAVTLVPTGNGVGLAGVFP